MNLSKLFFISLFIFILLIFSPATARAEVNSTDWVFPTQQLDGEDYMNPFNVLNRDANLATCQNCVGQMSVRGFPSFNIPENAKVDKLYVRVNSYSTHATLVISTFGGIDKCWLVPRSLYFDYQPSRSTPPTTDSIIEVNNTLNCDSWFTPERLNVGSNWGVNDSLKLRIYRYNALGTFGIDDISAKIEYSIVSPTPTSTPTPMPTETPSPTPTPTPEVLGDSTVKPFLDLPFEYSGSFDNAVLHPTSWFDHEYPLADVRCTKIFCPLDILKFNSTGSRTLDGYRHHNGYDYAGNGAIINHPVLAAASGSAEYIPEALSGGYGNLVKITHPNGYQTWYGHMQPQTTPISGHVEQGQPIGLVGESGNATAPHIHFTVLKDINGDEKFDQLDKPYGFVDPLGWEGRDSDGNALVDPWTQYESNDIHGSNSFNLFIGRAQPTEATIPISGGSMNLGDIHVSVLPNSAPTFLTIRGNISSYESQDDLVSAAPSFYLYAFNSLGESVKNFFEPVKLVYTYAPEEVFNIDEGTLKLYWYNEQTKAWEALTSTVDSIHKLVTAYTPHFSHFALMGRIKDKVAPYTEVVTHGDKGQDNWYRSSVSVELNGEDNEGGLGVQKTIYTVNGDEWLDYAEPLLFEDESEHKITYQSIDKAGNVEDQKSTTFIIDKTAPVTSVGLFGTEGNNGWYTSDVLLSLSGQDEKSGVQKIEYSLDGGVTYIEYTAPVLFSDEGSRDVLYRSVDKSGNVEDAKNVSFKIDKTPPATLVYTTGVAGSDGWYRSDVQVAFNPKDTDSGSAKTYYSLNDESNYHEYSDTLSISTEGVTKIFYYSVDNAGNEELHKSIEIKIDKTAPEAKIRFDTVTRDLVISGFDNLGTTNLTQMRVGSNKEQVTITDTAGNTLVIQNVDRAHGPNAVLSLTAFSYNGAVIVPDTNKLSIHYQLDKSDLIKMFEQKYEVKGVVKVLLSYDVQRNKTIVTQDGQKSELDGMRILQLMTDKGGIKYTW